MKLYMKQKAFSFADQFKIADENMNIHYTVEGEFFSWGKKLHVMDGAGREVAFIWQKLWSFLTRFFVEVQGEEVLEVVKEFTFMRPRYRLAGARNWRIEGDFWSHEYEIIDAQGRCIMRMSKHWFTWGDSYEMEIANPDDALMCVCAALAIDAAMSIEQSNN